MITPLKPSEVFRNWSLIEPMVQRIFDRFDYGYTTDDVLFDVMNETKMVWALGDLDGVAFLEVCRLPQFDVLDIPLMAGDNIDKWLPSLVDQLTQYAKVLGCKYVDGFGRKGWTRKLEEFGFKPYSYDVRLEV